MRRRRCEEEEAGLWRNLRLDWVRNWDQSSRTGILLSRVQHTGGPRSLSHTEPTLLLVHRNSCSFLSVCFRVEFM